MFRLKIFKHITILCSALLITSISINAFADSYQWQGWVTNCSVAGANCWIPLNEPYSISSTGPIVNEQPVNSYETLIQGNFDSNGGATQLLITDTKTNGKCVVDIGSSTVSVEGHPDFACYLDGSKPPMSSNFFVDVHPNVN